MGEKKKIKMLVIPSDRYGCGKFRSVDPHVYIGEHYANEFDVDIVYDIPKENLDQFFSQYDLIHIHKQLDKGMEMMNMIKFLGIPVIVDVDDYFFLGNDHPMSLSAKKEKWHEAIINHLKMADYCTTTTPIYAKELLKYNKNVAVFPNGINAAEEQFSMQKTPSDRLRIGLICGSSHLKDIELLRGFSTLLPLDKVQILLCGFDTNGTRTIYHNDTGQVERRPILPQESVWYDYEKIITDNYRIVSPEHKDFLMKFMKGVDDPFVNEPYRRMWTRDIRHYATHYQNVDVLLAPLKENAFNGMKSDLKAAECGFTNTALIAQNFGPYTVHLTPMNEKGGKYNTTGTAMLVESSKNHKQWAKLINTLVANPERYIQLRDNLHKMALETFSLDKICADRVKLYKQLVAEKQNY